MTIAEEFISRHNPLYRASLRGAINQQKQQQPEQAVYGDQDQEPMQEEVPPAPIPAGPPKTIGQQAAGAASAVGSAALGTAAAAGNILDVPGAIARGALTWLPGGAKPINPLAPLVHPVSGEGRIDGRELARSYGLMGQKNTTANFIGGIAVEMATDPTTYLGFGVLTKAAKALQKAGLLDDVAGAANKSLVSAAKTRGSQFVKNVGRRTALKVMNPEKVISALPKQADVIKEMMQETSIVTSQPFTKSGRAGGVFSNIDEATAAMEDGNLAAIFDGEKYKVVEMRDGHVSENSLLSPILDDRIKSVKTQEQGRAAYENAYRAMYGDTGLEDSFKSGLKSMVSVHLPLSNIHREIVAGRDPAERYAKILGDEAQQPPPPINPPGPPGAGPASPGPIGQPPGPGPSPVGAGPSLGPNTSPGTPGATVDPLDAAKGSAIEAANAAETASGTLPRMNAQSFKEAVRKVATSPEEADGAIRTFESMASAFGESADDFAARALAGVQYVDSNGPVGGMVKFLEDGRAMITAFNAKTPETLMHEIIHVARRHMKGDMLAKAEAVSGVKAGAEWTVKNEEEFVKRVLQSTKKHPSKRASAALKDAYESGLFGQVTKLVTGLYKSIASKDKLDPTLNSWLQDLANKQPKTAASSSNPWASTAGTTPNIIPDTPKPAIDLNDVATPQQVATESAVEKAKKVAAGSAPPKAVSENAKPTPPDTRTFDEKLAAAEAKFPRGKLDATRIAISLKMSQEEAVKIRDQILKQRQEKAAAALSKGKQPVADATTPPKPNDTVTPSAASEAPKVAEVGSMITARMEAALKAEGVSDDVIQNMIPDEALDILRKSGRLREDGFIDTKPKVTIEPAAQVAQVAAPASVEAIDLIGNIKSTLATLSKADNPAIPASGRKSLLEAHEASKATAIAAFMKLSAKDQGDVISGLAPKEAERFFGGNYKAEPKPTPKAAPPKATATTAAAAKSTPKTKVPKAPTTKATPASAPPAATTPAPKAPAATSTVSSAAKSTKQADNIAAKKEAKAKADAARAEVKAKAAKEKADAKAKADKEQADADAKAKADQDAKDKVGAEAKAKAEKPAKEAPLTELQKYGVLSALSTSSKADVLARFEKQGWLTPSLRELIDKADAQIVKDGRNGYLSDKARAIAKSTEATIQKSAGKTPSTIAEVKAKRKESKKPSATSTVKAAAKSTPQPKAVEPKAQPKPVDAPKPKKAVEPEVKKASKEDKVVEAPKERATKATTSTPSPTVSPTIGKVAPDAAEVSAVERRMAAARTKQEQKEAYSKLREIVDKVEDAGDGESQWVKPLPDTVTAKNAQSKAFQVSLHAKRAPAAGDPGGVLARIRHAITRLGEGDAIAEHIAHGSGDQLALKILSDIVPNKSGKPGFHKALHEWLKTNHVEYGNLVKAGDDAKTVYSKQELKSADELIKQAEASVAKDIAEQAPKPKLGSLRTRMLSRLDDEISEIAKPKVKPGSAIPADESDMKAPFLRDLPSPTKQMADLDPGETASEVIDAAGKYSALRRLIRLQKEKISTDTDMLRKSQLTLALRANMAEVNATEAAMSHSDLSKAFREYKSDIKAAIKEAKKGDPETKVITPKLKDDIQALNDELVVINKKIDDLASKSPLDAATANAPTPKMAKSILDAGNDKDGIFKLYDKKFGEDTAAAKLRRQAIARDAGFKVTKDASDHEVGTLLAKWAGVEADKLADLAEANNANARKILDLTQEKLQELASRTISGEKYLFHIPNEAEKLSLKQRYKARAGAWKKILSGVTSKDKDLGMAIAKSLDAGESILMGIAPVRHMIGIFDRRVFGETDAEGQKLARKLHESLEQAIFKFREVIAPMVRTVGDSSFLDEATVIEEVAKKSTTTLTGKQARDQAIELINLRHHAIAEVLEGIVEDLPSDLFEGAGRKELEDVLEIMQDMMPVRLMSEKMAGLKATPLTDDFAKYFKRKVQAPDRARFSKPVYHGQKLAGATHDSQNKRSDVFRNIARGRATIDRMSMDPDISGVWHKQDYITSKMGVDEFKKLTAIVQERYSEDIFGHANKKLSKAERKKLRQLTASVAGLDPWYAQTKTPYYGRNFLYDYAQRLQDGIHKEAVARTLIGLVGEGTSKGPKGSLIELLDGMGMGTNQAFRKVIDLAEQRGVVRKGAYKEFRVKTLKELQAKIAKELAKDEPQDIIRGYGENQFKLTVDNGKVYAINDYDQSNVTKTLVDERNLDDFESTARQFAEQEKIHVDKSIQDRAKRMLKPFNEPHELKGLSRVMAHSLNLFKTHATITNPAFHVRNIASAVVQNYFYDVYDPKAMNLASRYTKPYTQAVQMMKGQVLKGIAADIPALGFAPGQDEEATKALADLVFKYGVIGDKHGYAAERVSQSVSSLTSQLPGIKKHTAMDAIRKAITPAYGTRKRDMANPFHVEGFSLPVVSKQAPYVEATEFTDTKFYPGQLGMQASVFSENFNRMAPFIAFMKQGYSAEQAAKRVGKIQVDYSTLSEVEKKIKAFIPFYTFTSRILPTSINDMIRNPAGKQAWVVRGMGRASSSNEDTPDYIKEGLSIPAGTSADGSQHFITGFGLPVEDALKFAPILKGDWKGTAKEVGARMRPGIQASIEAVTGRSMFFNRDLDDLEPSLGRLRANVKQMATGEKTEGMPDPVISRDFEWALAKSPASRYINTMRAVTDQRRSATANLLTSLTGMKVASVSQDSMDRTAIDNASKQIKAMGGKTLETTYMPEWAAAKLTAKQASQVEALKKVVSTKRKEMKERKSAQEIIDEAAAGKGKP